MIHIRKKTRRLLALLQLVAGLTVVVILIWRLDNRKALLDNWRAALNSPGWIFAGIVFLGLSMFTTAWPFKFLQGHIKKITDLGRQTLQKPDMGHRCSQLNMAESFPPNL